MAELQNQELLARETPNNDWRTWSEALLRDVLGPSLWNAAWCDDPAENITGRHGTLGAVYDGIMRGDSIYTASTAVGIAEGLASIIKDVDPDSSARVVSIAKERCK